MDDSKLRVTRRQCLVAGGTAALAASAPALGQARLNTALDAPPGHDRQAPAFRRIDLGK